MKKLINALVINTETIHHDAVVEDGEIIQDAYDEIVEIPTHEIQYVDMTAEEEAELIAMQAEMPTEKSPEERIAELEDALDALLNGRTE